MAHCPLAAHPRQSKWDGNTGIGQLLGFFTCTLLPLAIGMHVKAKLRAGVHPEERDALRPSELALAGGPLHAFVSCGGQIPELRTKLG